MIFSVHFGFAQNEGNELDGLYTPPENAPFSGKVKGGSSGGTGYHAKNYVRFKPFLLGRGIFAAHYERTIADAIGFEGGLGTSFFPDYFMNTGIYADNYIDLNFISNTDYSLRSVPGLYAYGVVDFDGSVSQSLISGLFLNASVKFYYSGLLFDNLGFSLDFRFMRQGFTWKEQRSDELTESIFFVEHKLSFDHVNLNLVQSIFTTYEWGNLIMNHELYYGVGARMYYYKPVRIESGYDDFTDTYYERYAGQEDKTARAVGFTYILGYNIAFGWE
jgi:hypothetical protein